MVKCSWLPALAAMLFVATTWAGDAVRHPNGTKTDYERAPLLMPKPPFPTFTEHGFDALCLMIRRDFLLDVGGWPDYGAANEPLPRVGDDEVLLRIIVERGRYEIVRQALGYHRRLSAK